MPASSVAPSIAADLVIATELYHEHAGELGRGRRSPPTFAVVDVHNPAQMRRVATAASRVRLFFPGRGCRK